MIIHNPKIKIEKNDICISARIEFENNNLDMPKTMWYKFPKIYKNILSKSSNGFIVPLVPLAMYLGENIQVKGKMSSQLEYNLREYQKILNFWEPKLFKLIEIKCNKLEEDYGSKKPKNTMLPFSGGVDSFYTLWSHLPKNEPNKEFQITHSLFIHGYDISLKDKKTFEIAKKSYNQLMNKLNIEFITTSTNATYFRFGSFYHWIGNVVIVGTGLFFENLISRFYFSEDDNPDSPPPFGILGILTNLLSTEKFDTVSSGFVVSKLEKIKSISRWPETYNRLRVCWENPNGLKNCGKCWKCIFTMAFLDIANSLDKYSTFPIPIDRKEIRKIRIGIERIYFPRKWIKFAKETGEKEIAFDFRYILILSKLKHYSDIINLKIMKINEKIISIKNSNLYFNYVFNPIKSAYKISFKLKKRSPSYSKFVNFIKNSKKNNLKKK